MRQITITFCIILFTSMSLYAQRKSELIAEIHNLKSQLDSVKAEVFEARKNERVSLAEATSYKEQVVELQDANTTLLKNLSSFAEVSSKNSDNINKAMTSLNEKERQLKSINNAISSHDSTAVIVLTNVKKTLGENAKIGVSGGAVVISKDLIALFGGDTSTTVTTEAQSWLEKVANILTANPKMALTIEGLSMTGNLELAARQAVAISEVFQKQFTIAAERITILGKDGNFKEGVNLKIHPKYDIFYRMVKKNMKN